MMSICKISESREKIRNTLTNGPHYHSHTTSISLPLYYFVNKAILVSAKNEEILTV